MYQKISFRHLFWFFAPTIFVVLWLASVPAQAVSPFGSDARLELRLPPVEPDVTDMVYETYLHYSHYVSGPNPDALGAMHGYGGGTCGLGHYNGIDPIRQEYELGFLVIDDYKVNYTLHNLNAEDECVHNEPDPNPITRNQAEVLGEATVSCPAGYSKQEFANGDGRCFSNEKAYINMRAPSCPKMEQGIEQLVGNPCDVTTGDKRIFETDLEIGGLSLQRSYQSLTAAFGGNLGIGWTHNYKSYLVLDDATTPRHYATASGLVEPLTEVGSGVFVSQTGSGLVVKGDGTYWTAFFPDGSRKLFDYVEPIRILKIINAADQEITFAYNARKELPNRITDWNGNYIQFYYTAKNLVNRIVDSAGREFKYEYSGWDAGDEDWTSGDARLLKVIYPDDSFKEYLYEDSSLPNHITGIMDENGDRYSTYSYYPDGRAHTSEHAGYEKVTLVYDSDTQTTVTDGDGNNSVYQYTENLKIRKFEYDGVEYNSLEAAIAAVRIKHSNGKWEKMQPYRWSGAAASSSSSLFPMVTSMSVGGGSAALLTPKTGDHARRTEDMLDEGGGSTHFVYGDYHTESKTEAYGTTLARTTDYEYLEDESALPRFVRSESVAGGGLQKVTETKYEDASFPRLPTQIIESGYRPDGTSAPDRITSFTYTSSGLLESVDGPAAGDCTPSGSGFTGDCTFYTWHETDPVDPAQPCLSGGQCGQMASIKNAKGHVTTFDEYFPEGWLKQSTSPTGLVTSYAYNWRGQPLTVTEAYGTESRVTAYSYDDAGQLESATMPNNMQLTYEWLPSHLLWYVEDNYGNRIEYEYDLRGNRKSELVKDSSGSLKKQVTMVFDAHNHLDTINQGASLIVTETTYDALGNLTNSLNNNHETINAYDELNRLETSTNPAGKGSIYEYDVNDNVTKVTAPNNVITEYEYDDLGNLLKEESADRGTTLYGYDAAGNVTCKADGRISGSSSDCASVSGATVYLYDNLNRLTDIQYPNDTDENVQFIYDGWGFLGRLWKIDDKSGYTNFTYSGFGEQSGQYNYIDDGIGGVEDVASEYVYNSGGELETITYQTGRDISYTRDSLGRITGISSTFRTDPNDASTEVTADVVTDVSYKPFGPVEWIEFDNGIEATYTHDDAYQTTQVEVGTASNVSAVVDWDNIRDPAGNIDQITQDGTLIDFSYDALDRLTYDDTWGGAQSFMYDHNGNRTSDNLGNHAVDTSTPSNRITHRNGSALSYDGMGNITNNGANAVMTYNAAGRLETLDKGPNYVSNLYNGRGERVHSYRTGNASVIDAIEYYAYAPDGRILSMVATELIDSNGDGTYDSQGVRTITDWVWMDDIPIAQFVETYLTTALNSHVSTQVVFLHGDHLNTPKRATDDTGTVVWKLDSDAHGVGWQTTDPDSDGVHTRVPLRFPGQIAYGIQFFAYNYYRDYDPYTGRYLESDPLGVEAGFNTFGYVSQNPLKYFDPLGLVQCTTFTLPISVRMATTTTRTWHTPSTGIANGVMLSVSGGGDTFYCGCVRYRKKEITTEWIQETVTLGYCFDCFGGYPYGPVRGQRRFGKSVKESSETVPIGNAIPFGVIHPGRGPTTIQKECEENCSNIPIGQ